MLKWVATEGAASRQGGQGRKGYELIELLDEGPGRERLYRARCTQPEEGGPEWVHIRVLPPTVEARAHARLEEEALIGLQVLHRNVARIHAFHREQGYAFLVSEALAGESLDVLIARAALRGRPLSERLGLHVGVVLADALHYVHTLEDAQGRELRVVHRDVCPANVWLDGDGEPKLAGFGAVLSKRTNRPRTSPLRIRGDYAYAAPERLIPLMAEVDARADLFSLGLVLLEVMTCRHLYDEDDVELAARQGAPSPERLRYAEKSWTTATDMARRAASFTPEDVLRLAQGLSAPVKAVLCVLLCREHAERPGTAQEARDMLRACLERVGRGYTARHAARDVARLGREAGRFGSASPLRAWR